MKSFILIIVFLVSRSSATRAQTIPVLTQQLAALQDLLHTSEKGYQSVENGLHGIGTITRGEFQLHDNYFDSLSSLNPGIANNPKVAALRSLQMTLVHQINAALAGWRQQRSNQP